MTPNIMAVVNRIYDSQAKRKALFRDLKMYQNAENSYKNHRGLILEEYLNEAREKLFLLNKKYKGKPKEGLMDEFLELSSYIEAIEFMVGFDKMLYNHLDRKTRKKKEENIHDPY